MVTTVLGKVAVTPKGEWSSNVTYEKLDVVSYNGSSYLSVKTVPASTPLTNTEYWLLLAQKGDTGNAIASIEKTGTSGLTDTYTITFTNGSTSDFTVTNGEAATVIVGTVATGAAGTAVVITNSGDEHDAVLNFTIPRGDTGNGISGIELTGTSGGVKTYTITFTDGDTFSFDVTDGEVTEERLAEALSTKADNDGYYEEMTVGDAEQLVSSQYVTDSVPYLYRTTGGSADVGNREYMESIVGGTVAWNQLRGVRSTTNTNTDTRSLLSLQFNTYGSPIVTWASPKVVSSTGVLKVIGKAPSSSDGNIRIKHNGASSDLDIAVIQKKAEANHVYMFSANFTGIDPATVGGLSADDIMFFDLTQMFDSTIADYIYSLEQSSEGAGIAKLKSWGLFDKDYYEYDAGTLKSVEGLISHDTNGFNQWDEEWEVGAFNTSNGTPITASNRIRSKNYIEVLPSTTYYVTAPVTLMVCQYDQNKNFLITTWQKDNTFTTRDKTAYIRFATNADVTPTYNHDICINLSWSGWRNGEYEPYQKHSYPLDSSLVLRGIPKLDAQNNLYFDGDVYKHDGTVERRYGEVSHFQRTELDSTRKLYRIATLSRSGHSDAAEGYAICDKLPTVGLTKCRQNSEAGIKSVCIYGTSAYVGGYIGNESELDSLLSNGMTIVYELATPTTEEAEPFQEVQICDDFGTEEFVTESIVPVGHNTEYPANLRDKLQHLPNLADADGYYMIKQTDKQMSLEHFRIPKAPTEDGTWVLKAVVSGGTPTYSWVKEETA